MPPGLRVILPLPLPLVPRLSRAAAACPVKLALTVVVPLILSVQLSPVVPAQAPCQLPKAEPRSATALRMTLVGAPDLQQPSPQRMPPGLRVILPLPLPLVPRWSRAAAACPVKLVGG